MIAKVICMLHTTGVCIGRVRARAELQRESVIEKVALYAQDAK